MKMKEVKPRHNNTSREARDRWDSEHLTKIMLSLNNETDADILSAVRELKTQGYKTTDAFRELIRNGLK